MKPEWPFPYPKQVAAWAIVLNFLRYQPARFQDMVDEAKDNIGADEIERAGAWLGVVEERVKGERVWERPTGLAAIWWSSRGLHLFKWRPSVMACA